MEPVSVERGVSWLPATMTLSVRGSAARSRANWRYACTIAVLVGRTWWNTSPPISTTSGASSITLSTARVNDCATSASRWLIPRGVSR